MSTITNNRVLSGNIIPTFLYYVIPSSIGLIAITTANLVDSIFLGNYVGADALASITLLVPYFTLLFATALMLSIGGSVSAGKYLGEQDSSSASSIFSQSLIATIIITSSFSVVSLFFEQQLFQLLHAPQSLHPLMAEYLDIIRWSLIIQLFTMVLYYFVRADGHPLLATGALVCGAIINIALDAVFIGVLDMGIKGAAYATLIAQVFQCLVLCRYFFSSSRILKFSCTQLRWNKLLRAVYNGVSEFINEISVGLIFLLLNYLILERVGINGVAAFTVINYFIFISVMLCYGIADALHLLISQNFGAKNTQRIHYFLITALTTAAILAAILLLILWQWQDTAIDWFLKDNANDVSQVAQDLFILIWPLFLVNGVNIILSCYLTAIHQPKPSALISIARSLIFPGILLTALFYLLPEQSTSIGFLSEWSFLLALPIAEWSAFILAAFLSTRYYSSIFAKAAN